uniref:Thiol:disulfide interchange protein dsbE homolog n=1 Tax=Magnetococcus massalia (strain MO-1) TaxID=451514 RepID=A0A1S7LQ33_MAGMO|nr:Thiol:disulfide interchange protein dsbE homolog [Candidatus Magnetococcus massalia]
MGKIWKLVLMGVIAIILVMFFMGLGRDTKKIPTPLTKKPAPELVGPSLKGEKTINLKDQAGKWVLVNFWGSWCAACISEHPYLIHLGQRVIPNRDDFAVIGVDYKDTRGRGLGFLARHGDPGYDQIFDPDQKMAINWGIVRAPESYLVSPEGMIVHKQYGPLYRGWFEEIALPYIEGKKK